MSTDLDQIALDTATAIMRMYFEPIPGVQLKAKIQEVVRDAMGRAEQPSNPVPLEEKPIAYMRKWAFDGEKPVKSKNAAGRISWGKFKLLPVTQGKCQPDDIPLVARIVGQQTKGGGKPAKATLKRCAAGRDGECCHAQCPQLRDGEPARSGRHCPLDTTSED